MGDKDIFPIGLAEGVKTKTNYNLVGLVFAGFVAGFVASCIWLPNPWKGTLAALFAIAMLGSIWWIPQMMKQMPPSEQFRIGMAQLGYEEIDGKLKRIRHRLTSAQNPHQLPPAPPEKKEGGTNK